MPSFRGISVFVEKPEGEQFTEFDTQTLRSSGPTKQLSTKIMCEDNQPFRIKVSSEYRAIAVRNATNVNGRASYNLPSKHSEWNDEGKCRLFFKVYMDGNEFPECSYVKSVGSSDAFTGRWSANEHGSRVTTPWKFKSAPLEHLFRQSMEIEQEEHDIPKNSTDRDLIEMQTRLGGDLLAPATVIRAIEVRASRVYSYDVWKHSTMRTPHIIGFEEGTKEKRSAVTSQLVYADEGKQPYVTFRFLSMARHKLFTLGLCTESGAPIQGQGMQTRSGARLLPLQAMTMKRNLESFSLESPSREYEKPKPEIVDEDFDNADGSRKRRLINERFAKMTLNSPTAKDVDTKAETINTTKKDA
ncbi:hypothetical protein LTR84_008433 [Exophiala bonariae]|uniref:Uncharacterized protein n=1 Tax=Exophiala bonariae TaxID=1690606 RepID=A0AAV9MZA2_9EURO|nr:hypothetical protein LTR84_008433 [Exophiala bonariae]